MRWHLIALFASVLLFGSTPGLANVEAETDHTKARTYSAALRYLRIDLGYEVTEQDSEAAYLLFRFKHGRDKRLMRGSVEIVQAENQVRVFVKIPELPEYEERRVSDGLMAKLRREYGDPPRRERPKPKTPPKDSAFDEDSDSDSDSGSGDDAGDRPADEKADRKR